MGDGPDIFLVENYADVQTFWLALLPLAVERSGPLLALSGLPSAIVEAPEPIRELSHSTISAIRAIRWSGAVDEFGHHEAIRAVADFVGGMTTAYGSNTVAELVGWLRCFHMDRASRNRLSAWGSALQLAAGMRSLEGRSPTLDTATLEVLVALAQTGFGPTANAKLSEASSTAYQIPLSGAEERLLALEVSQPGDVPHRDVIQDMQLSATLSSARAIRTLLKERLAPHEFHAIVSWAREFLEMRGAALAAKALTSDLIAESPEPCGP